MRSRSRARPLLLAPLLQVAALQLALGQLLGGPQPSQPAQYQQHNNILHFVVPEGAPPNTYLGNIRSAEGHLPNLVLPVGQTPESERIAALTVNLANGSLTTNAVLDREHREQYHFVAVVTQPFAEIKCTVTVKDINDNAPMFLMPASADNNYVIEMPENQRGIRKLLPLAVDFDTPQFGIKEFRIVSGNTPTGTFQLVEHEAPARSTLNQAPGGPADLDLGAGMLAAGADGLSPQLIQQLAQQATVLIPSQPVMVQSSSQPAAQSALAQAGQSPSTKFLIDLELSQTLDRENQSSYQLVVEAIDGGQPPLLGRLMVTVNVLDVNDNDPVFSRKLYECHFREDTPKGTLLIRVQALDADLDANGQVSYFIKRISSSSQPVNLINSSSSDNLPDTFANNAAKKLQTLSLSPSPNGAANANKQQQQQPTRPQQIATTNVIGNKLTPQRLANNEFYDAASSSADSSSAFKPKQQQQQSNFPQAQQIALDQSSAQPTQQQAQLFEIDPVKGEIYLTYSLDYETDQLHELLIEARDHGRPSRSAYAVVKVFVIDFFDDPPKKQPVQVPSSEASRSELLATGRSASDLIDMSPTSFNIIAWFAHVNSSLLFIIVLVALFAVAFPLCLVKIKSRQPESDYNDTAGLTLTSNNGQTKPSPNHSMSNDHTNGVNANDVNHSGYVKNTRTFVHTFPHLRRHDHLQLPDACVRSDFGLENRYTPSRVEPLDNPLCGRVDLTDSHSIVHESGGDMGTLCSHHDNRRRSNGSCYENPYLQQTLRSSNPLDSPTELLHHIPGGQLPPTPGSANCTGLFSSWPQTSAPPPHLGCSHEMGSYNWDYLKEWKPEYQNIMLVLQSDACARAPGWRGEPSDGAPRPLC